MNFKEWLKETEVVAGTNPKLPKNRTFNMEGTPGTDTKVNDGEPIKSGKKKCPCK